MSRPAAGARKNGGNGKMVAKRGKMGGNRGKWGIVRNCQKYIPGNVENTIEIGWMELGEKIGEKKHFGPADTGRFFGYDGALSLSLTMGTKAASHKAPQTDERPSNQKSKQRPLGSPIRLYFQWRPGQPDTGASSAKKRSTVFGLRWPSPNQLLHRWSCPFPSAAKCRSSCCRPVPPLCALSSGRTKG